MDKVLNLMIILISSGFMKPQHTDAVQQYEQLQEVQQNLQKTVSAAQSTINITLTVLRGLARSQVLPATRFLNSARLGISSTNACCISQPKRKLLIPRSQAERPQHDSTTAQKSKDCNTGAMQLPYKTSERHESEEAPARRQNQRGAAGGRWRGSGVKIGRRLGA